MTMTPHGLREGAAGAGRFLYGALVAATEMRRSLVAALLALLTVPTVAARGGMPSPLTERGQVIEGIYYPVFIAATVVFVIVVVLLGYALVRFRAKGGAGRETFELERDNLKLEMTWIVIPLIVVLWVGVISYAGLVELDEGIKEGDAWMELDITGYQWTWLADYGSDISMFSDPDPTNGDVADEKVFIVPADRAIRFNVTGGDVIHAWHLMDANWATVGLVDANPFGPHKYTSFTAVLPVGEYHVQCREMCFNPGHGYMRARIQAVPEADFQSWMSDKGLAAGADLAQQASVSWTGSALEGDVTFVTGEGARGIVSFSNAGETPVSLTAPGFDTMLSVYSYDNGPKVALTSTPQVSVGPGESVKFAFDIAEAGSFAFNVNGESLPFQVVEAEAVSVDLGDFFIEPKSINLEAGKTYLFQINNVGATSHNLFIGMKNADGQTITWESATIGGGATTSFLVTPDVAMKFDTWCNVPGHWPAMAGTLTVQ